VVWQFFFLPPHWPYPAWPHSRVCRRAGSCPLSVNVHCCPAAARAFMVAPFFVRDRRRRCHPRHRCHRRCRQRYNRPSDVFLIQDLNHSAGRRRRPLPPHSLLPLRCLCCRRRPFLSLSLVCGSLPCNIWSTITAAISSLRQTPSSSLLTLLDVALLPFFNAS
jgi:hypothetical protein